MVGLAVSAACSAEYLLTRRGPDEQTEDRAAVAVGPQRSGCPIECTVDALHQRAPGRLAVSAVEVMQSDQRPAGRDFEDRATAAMTAGAGPACRGRTASTRRTVPSRSTNFVAGRLVS